MDPSSYRGDSIGFPGRRSQEGRGKARGRGGGLEAGSTAAIRELKKSEGRVAFRLQIRVNPVDPEKVENSFT